MILKKEWHRGKEQDTLSLNNLFVCFQTRESVKKGEEEISSLW